MGWRPSPEKEKVLNFIQNSSRPFSGREVISKTGVCEETVRVYLREMKADGMIKKISNKGQRNIYMKMPMTPELRKKLKMGKMRIVADWLHKHALGAFYSGITMLTVACSGNVG